MSHRKKAVVLLLGIFVTIVLFLFFQALFMPKYMESMKEGALIAEYDKDSLNHEVVFIGDCEVYENFSPVTLWNHQLYQGKCQPDHLAVLLSAEGHVKKRKAGSGCVQCLIHAVRSGSKRSI